MFGPGFAWHWNHLEDEAVLILLRCKNERIFTANLLAAELQMFFCVTFQLLEKIYFVRNNR